jgi:DNA-binding NarL/FixJ family response regulator
MKTKVLWIEDSVLVDLDNVYASAYACGRYDMTLAFDVTEGIRKLAASSFDAIVIDIRLPPGTDPDWIRLYNQAGANRASARLGLALAASLVAPSVAQVQLPHPPTWITPSQIAFLSVERHHEVLSDLQRLGITNYREKSVGDPHALRELLDLVIRTAGTK